ncbi:MAG: 2TM domain-containing protein [Solirubrobacterales bacterium]|nr:2TM domain-containing protein [Solirubrobacterales bacterium]MCB0863052.1 2TM domain-containing protein [Solirubrobacterales bacterium]MCB8915894.1 2TM domain-containing protein [Thermoleophilales bacterium]
MEASDPNKDLRDEAVKSLNAKHDFMIHLATFGGVSIFLVLIWALSGTDNFFWPIFPIVGWGIFGLIPHWWSVYRSKGLTEDKIQAEMEKIRREGGPSV